MNNESFNDYKELKNYREGKKFYEGRDKSNVKLMKLGLSGFGIGLIIMGIACGGTLLFSGDSTLETLSIIIPMGTCMISYYIMDLVYPEYESRVNKKSFKKKYSNVDMDISDEQLDLIINNTKEESYQNVKDRNNINNDEFNNMNDDSKIEDLEKRIESLKELKSFYEAKQIKDNCNNKIKKLTK